MAFNRTYDAGNVDTNRGAASQIIPPGEYEVKIVAANDAISKSSGKDMIKLELDILTPPYDKRKLWYYITDDQYADQKCYDIFSSAGKKIPKNINSNIFVGLVCKVKTKNRLYNGETQAEINYWVKSAGGVSPEMGPASTEDIADDIPF